MSEFCDLLLLLLLVFGDQMDFSENTILGFEGLYTSCVMILFLQRNCTKWRGQSKNTHTHTCHNHNHTHHIHQPSPLPMRFHHHLYNEQDPDICLQIWSTITMQLPGMDHKGGLRFLPWSFWWWWWSYWSWWWSSGCCSGDKPWLHGGDGEQPRLLAAASLWGWNEPASCQGDLMLNSFAWFIWNGVDPPFIMVTLPKPRF